MKKLYVGNLPFQTSEQELQDWFAEASIQVDSVTLIRDKYTNQLRGFGFVEISNDDEAGRAIQLLNGKDFQSRPLTVNEARPRREGGGGGRGGGGSGRRQTRKQPRW
ncbi:MAG: RNA recognition motif domain-containing protein [Terriglobia bacterium]